jgi:two-component system, NarL family, nitrate/nitrite response regulator NarL
MTRVLVADSHRLLADLMSGFLAAHGVEVVGVATTAAEAEARARTDRPDLCLVDAATLAPAEPGALLGRLVATGVRVVVLTGAGDDPHAALETGAAAFLRKTVSGGDLLAALDRVVHGEVVVLDAGREAPVDPNDADAVDARRRLARLRTRERECLELIAGGASTEEMAAAMGVTLATVRSHVRAVLAALDVHTRLGAASFALRHGVVGASVPGRAPSHRAG